MRVGENSCFQLGAAAAREPCTSLWTGSALVLMSQPHFGTQERSGRLRHSSDFRSIVGGEKLHRKRIVNKREQARTYRGAFIFLRCSHRHRSRLSSFFLVESGREREHRASSRIKASEMQRANAKENTIYREPLVAARFTHKFHS